MRGIENQVKSYLELRESDVLGKVTARARMTSGRVLILAFALCLLLGIPPVAADTLPTQWEDPDDTSSIIYNFPEEARYRCANNIDYAQAIIYWRKNAKRLLIFLEGGGGCVDSATCRCDSAHPIGPHCRAFFIPSRAEIDGGFTFRGFKDFYEPLNPFREGYNVIHLKHCEADMYSGASTAEYQTPQGDSVVVPHNGYHIVRHTLRLAKRLFPYSEKVVFWGTSAGGFGVTSNLHQLRDFFSTHPLYVISDSGPPIKRRYTDGSYFEKIYEHWNMKSYLPDDFDFGRDGLFDSADIARYNRTKFPDIKFALIQSYNDFNISAIADDPQLFLASWLSSDGLTKNLIDLHENDFSESPNYQVFYLNSYLHQSTTPAFFKYLWAPNDWLLYYVTHPATPIPSVVLGLPFNWIRSKGVHVGDWVKAMIEDDPSWSSVVPVPSTRN